MALRNIITDEDPQLLKKSREITQFNERLHQLIDDMRETLIDAHGMGLAAPQVGVLRRLVLVINEDDEIVELLNPEILETEGEQDGPEGCLSCPGIWGLVVRPDWVRLKAQDRDGKTFFMDSSGLSARACCHEIDHLDGVIFKSIAHEFIDESEVANYRDDDEYYDEDTGEIEHCLKETAL